MSDFSIPGNQREFRCRHCQGKIMIPWDLPPTTGPCPHCSGVITSPPPPGAPHAEAPVFQAPPAESPAPEPSAAAPPTPVPPPVILPGRREPVPPPAQTPPPAANAEPPPAAPPARPPQRHGRSVRRGIIPAMMVILVLILAIGGAIFFVSKEMGRKVDPPITGLGGTEAIAEAEYLRAGWQKDARESLRKFLAGTNVADKLPHVLHGQQLREIMEDFYGGSVIDDSDTPADAFSVYELSMEDRKRGIFMMEYNRPPQFEMKEFFRPLASLEVQYGLEDADLLLSYNARAGNFTMEPVRVHAFFKRTPSGLKLDWELFSQTKYRTFQNFTELPDPGQTRVFRVFVIEDIPDARVEDPGSRTYRLADPANSTDTARVRVKVDSETGRTLSVINWRGTQDARPIARTATMELGWTQGEQPELVIERFICWEFLGLGGSDPAPTAAR